MRKRRGDKTRPSIRKRLRSAGKAVTKLPWRKK